MMTGPPGSLILPMADGMAGQKRTREDDAFAAVAGAGAGIGAGGDKKWPGWPGECVFRLLVPSQKVGSIIGRKGELIKKMCEDSKARIKILDAIPGEPQRVVMVSAKDEPDSIVSPAMNGLLKVCRRIIEGDSEGLGAQTMGGNPGMVSCRVLVVATQAGSLIGKQGTTIKSIQDASGATVRVLSEEPPLSALADDRIVEVQGEAPKVYKALELALSHLRKFLVDRTVLPLFEMTRAFQNPNQQPSMQNSWGHNTASSISAAPAPNLSGSSHYTPSNLQRESYMNYQSSEHLDPHNLHHGVSMYGRDPGVGGLTQSMAAPPPATVITQVTQHMQVPLSYADAIIGSAGANISYARRTSGATVTIQETRGVPGEMTIEIYGTASQVQTAQQLIQGFMAGGSNVSSTYGAQAPSTYATTDAYSSYNQSSLYSSGPPAGPTSSTYGPSYSGSYVY